MRTAKEIVEDLGIAEADLIEHTEGMKAAARECIKYGEELLDAGIDKETTRLVKEMEDKCRSLLKGGK